LLDCVLLPVYLLAELGSPRLILHYLRVQVLALTVLDLVLVLLVHLLLCVESLLRCKCRLVRRYVAASLALLLVCIVRKNASLLKVFNLLCPPKF